MWRHTRRTCPALRGNEAFNQTAFEKLDAKEFKYPLSDHVCASGFVSCAPRSRSRTPPAAVDVQNCEDQLDDLETYKQKHGRRRHWFEQR
jgi:hypothetical protein